MEISHREDAGLTIVAARGRLDGTWADHLGQALDEHLRGGRDRVVLDMADIEYVSSLGLRALLGAYKRYKAVGGSFGISTLRPQVLKVLELAGLAGMLLAAPATPASDGVGRERAKAAPAAPEVFARPTVRGEFHPQPGQGFRVRVHGQPERLHDAGFAAAAAQSLEVRRQLVAIGLGAFGETPEECRDRYGEFLAIAGAAAYQPGDGSRTCDTLVTEGSYVPRVQSLYGLACTGAFSRLARFEPAADGESVPLGALADLALEMTASDLACVVIAGESAGLAGASLRRSPVEVAGAHPLAFPEVRQWLSLTTEKAHVRASAVTCGVVGRPDSIPAALQPFLRPLGGSSSLAGHLHAAVFRFRALPRGSLAMETVVRNWFEHETVQDVLHLLADDRNAEAVLESAFTRGALWAAPLSLEGTP